MKDYSEDQKQAKQYILSYKIKDGKIISKLASGEVYIIPYNEKNEEAIKNIMEKQAEKAQSYNFNPRKKLSQIVSSVIAVLSPVLFFTSGGNIVYLCTCLVSIGVSTLMTIDIMNTKTDIKKLEYYLLNKTELNENLVNSNSENMILTISKNASKEIKHQIKEDKEPITLNNIDSYSLKDLKALKSNLERIEAFGIEETNSEVIDKPKVYEIEKK